mmetsp:Transcript_58777/g.143775  ORF Transcript_58777/g.143775 Transcript_58777/m.143775 type:complete len:615 (-) Transcript_58777:87-1931(-)
MSPHEEESKVVDVDFGSGDGGSSAVSVDTKDDTTTTTTSAVEDPWGGFSAPSSSSLSSDPKSTSTSNDPKSSVPLKARLSNFRNQVSERMAASKARQQSARAIAEEAAKKELEEKAASKVLTELKDEETYEHLRPSKISVSVFKGENESYGFGLDQKDGEKMLKRNVVITSLVEEGLLRDSPLKEGDCIRRVNGRRATDAEACVEQLIGLTGYVSIEAETPQGNPALVTAFCRKPSAGYDNLGLSLVNVEHEHEQQQESAEDNEDTTQDAADNEDGKEDKDTSKAGATENEEDKEKTDTAETEIETATTTTKTKTKTRLLKIGDIEKSSKDDSVENEDNVPNAGLLADSVLSPGDLVLAINDTPCANMDAEEAMKLIRDATDTVTIVALNPEAHATASGPTRAQRFMRQAKRTSIAIGGGSMVGVGLILIPTVPPPFGEVLIAGGVTVLSSEFEAPKRVVRNARDSLETSVGRNETTAAAAAEATAATDDSTALEEADNQSEVEASEQQTNKEAEKSNSPPKWGRLKKFSRNYVLPFLDHVVGDKKHEHEKEDGKQEKDDASSSAPTKVQSDPTKKSEETITASDNSKKGEVDADETNDLQSTAAAAEEKKVEG